MSFLLIKELKLYRGSLHLHTFGNDEHNAKPVTNDFAMKQGEKHRAATMNSNTQVILTWYTSSYHTLGAVPISSSELIL